MPSFVRGCVNRWQAAYNKLSVSSTAEDRLVRQLIMTKQLNFESIFQSLTGAYIIFDVNDPDFTILDENQTHAEIAMVKREDVVGKPLLEAFPDSSDDYVKRGESALLNSIRKTIATKLPDEMAHLHYDLKDQTGTLVPKYWSVTHYPVMNNGEVTAVYQETKDITDSVEAGEQLTQARGQLERTLLYSGIGTWNWDMRKGTITGDANLAAMYDLDAAELANGVNLKEFIKAVHPDDKASVEKGIEEAINNDTLYESEYRTIHANKDIRWVLARGRVEREGTEAVRFPGVVIDITDRKLAESNVMYLNQATRQFAASLDYRETLHTIATMVVPGFADWCSIDLLENETIELVAVTHVDPKKVTWAKELRKQQGSPSLDEPGGVSKVIRTGVMEYIPMVSDEMLVASARNEEELKLLRDIGFSSVIIVPLVIDDRTIGAISLISSESHRHYGKADVEMAQALANRAALAVYNANLYTKSQEELHERTQLQSELEQLNTKLETRVLERTTELQNANEVLTDEIQRRHHVESELQEYSHNLAESNQQLQDFAYVASHDLQEPLRKIQAFGDILDGEYAERLGDGVEYLNRMKKAAARMSVLIEDLLSFSRVSANNRPRSVVNLNEIADDVKSDLETQIQRTKGTVELDTLPIILADATHMRQLFQNLIGNALKFHKDSEAPIVKVYAKKSGDTHIVYFEDNGIGFDEKYIDKIFSVFQRLHGKDEYEGTGIGLAVVRKIAERYGGTITVTSTLGKGSLFAFTFQTVKNEEA